MKKLFLLLILFINSLSVAAQIRIAPTAGIYFSGFQSRTYMWQSGVSAGIAIDKRFFINGKVGYEKTNIPVHQYEYGYLTNSASATFRFLKERFVASPFLRFEAGFGHRYKGQEDVYVSDNYYPSSNPPNPNSLVESGYHSPRLTSFQSIILGADIILGNFHLQVGFGRHWSRIDVITGHAYQPFNGQRFPGWELSAGVTYVFLKRDR